MYPDTTRHCVRPQLESLEGRWQPGLFSVRAAFADFLAARFAFLDDDGPRGRCDRDDSRNGRGGRHDHDCHHRHHHHHHHHRHHRHCDRPDPAPTPAPQPQLGSLSGFVFVDLNGNGTPDTGEQRIAGALIVLTWNDANSVPQEMSVETGEDGSYRFANLAGGIEYMINEVQPFPFGDSADHLGSLGGEQADDMFRVVLPAGANGVNYNFTEVFGE
jgi:hypothetical protein